MTLIAPQQMMAPAGELELAMYPGMTPEDLTERLQAYLDDGYSKSADASDVDAAALAWAYYRAYKARLIQLASMPASVNVPGEVATTRTDDQRGTFQTLAQQWLDTFYGYIPGSGENDTLIPPSGTSKTHYGWAGTLQG